MRVVLGGSRNLNVLPDTVQQRLDAWMNTEATFLIGDASGIDTAFQAHLRNHEYTPVVIYTSANSVRNNIGNWEVVVVDSGLKSASAARHTAKDRKMTELADAGLMMWNQESIGTLANILDLARQGKDVTVYDAVENELSPFEAGLHLELWLAKHTTAVDQARKRLRAYDAREARRAAAHKPSDEDGTLFNVDG